MVPRPSVVRRSVVHNAQRSSSPKAKFYVETPMVGGTKVCSQHLGMKAFRYKVNENLLT